MDNLSHKQENTHSSQDAKDISCRVTRTLLLYVKEQNNGTLGSLLAGLSLDETYLSDVNNWVSHSFLQTLYGRMVDLLGDENAVYNMTLASERLQSLGILDRIVRLLGSPKLIYSQAPKYNKYLKLNGSVYIREIGESSVLLEDRYHDGAQKTKWDCDYTRGILAGIPTMFGLPQAEVEEVKCQVARKKYGHRIWPHNPPHGCGGCLYRVHWNTDKVPFWKRFFLKRRSHLKAIEDLGRANATIQAKYDEIRELANQLKDTNKRLAESERKYRLMAENVSDTMFIINLPSLTIDFVSPSVQRLRGFTPEEAMALGIEGTLSPESLMKVSIILKEELARDHHPGVDPMRSRTIEVENSLKGGGYAWVETTVSFVRDESGDPVAVLGVTRDISARKQAERKILESEKRYRNLFENGTDLICIHDLEGNLIKTNLPFKEEEYGWRAGDLEGANIRDLLPEKQRPGFDEYLHRILETGSDEGYLKASTPLGKEVILEYRNKLIRDDMGRPEIVQGSARDITERKKAEDALRRSEEKYRDLVENIDEIIYTLDEKGQITYVSPVIEQKSGYAQSELIGHSINEFLHPDDLPRLLEQFQKVQSGHLKPNEYRLAAKSGEIHWVRVSSRPVYEGDRFLGLRGVLSDITESKRLRSELQQAQRIEAIGTLAGGVAHDFNNLLMGIQGRVSLLESELGASHPLREHMEAIEDYVESASSLTQQLLGLARAGKYEVNPIEVNELLLSSANMFGRTRKEIRIHTKTHKDPLVVDADEQQIKQALLNIYINAWQAMPAGGDLYIEASAVLFDDADKTPGGMEPGKYVKISIVDTGTGMDETTRQRIFDPFFTTREKSRGTGLGLASAYGIFKNHGGTITVDSEIGHGTSFHVFLPASANEIAPEKAPGKTLMKGAETILLVDDERMIQEVASEMLKTLGYEVLVAGGGPEAIETIAKRGDEIDLVVLDLIMPGMDGGTAFDQIRAIRPHMPIVLSSGYAIDGRARDIISRGCNGFIQKPFNISSLSQKLREIMDNQETTGNVDSN